MRLCSNAFEGQISERNATPLANAELLHAWMIFQHAEISQAGANEKIARPTPDLQLFPAQPDALLNFALGRSEYRTAGTVKQQNSQGAACQIFDIERFVERYGSAPLCKYLAAQLRRGTQKKPGGAKSHPKLFAGTRLGLTCGTRPRAARGRRKHPPSNATNSAANHNPAARFLLLRPCNNERVVLLRSCNNLVQRALRRAISCRQPIS